MLTNVIAWIYRLIVESHVIYHYLLPRLKSWLSWYLISWYQSDHVTDDSGRTMRVTRWNGRNVTAFTHHRYSTIKDVRIRKDDVFVCGYPKTGCHWAYEIVHMLTHGKAEVSTHGKRFEGMIDALPDICLDSVPSPRVLNSHVLYEELPRGIQEHKNKIVLTVRCPKDTVVSYYYHTVNQPEFYQYDGTFDDYFEMFMRGEVDHADFFDTYLLWSQAMKKEQQQDNGIFLLEFEELKNNTIQTIMKLATFLEIPITRDFAERVRDATQFSKLKEKRDSPLYRKGVVGDWKNMLTKEQSARIDRVWREKMAGWELSTGIHRYCQSAD